MTPYSRLRREANRIVAELVPATEIAKHVAAVDKIVSAAKDYAERLGKEKLDD